MEEEWRDIKGYEGLYQISNKGKIKSLERLSPQKHLIPEKILNTCHAEAGYVDVSLYKDGKRMHKKPHKLVAEAFIPNPDNLPEVDHIDANKDNNCVENLRWVTHKENCIHPLRRELLRKINLGKKMTPEQIAKQSIQITVLKDNIPIHTFKSYKDMDENSKDIFGFTLWNVYARKVLRGEMLDYHGYTFKVQ